MRHELLDVLQYCDDLSFLDRREIVEEFGQRPAVLQIVDQSPHRHTRAYEDGRTVKDLPIGVNTGYLFLQGTALPTGMCRV